MPRISELKHLLREMTGFIGATILNVAIGDGGALSLYVVDKEGQGNWLDINSDPEGNGPGWIHIEEDGGDHGFNPGTKEELKKKIIKEYEGIDFADRIHPAFQEEGKDEDYSVRGKLDGFGNRITEHGENRKDQAEDNSVPN